MSYVLLALLLLFVIATFATLIFGVIVMGKGGDNASKLSNKLMITRVCMQGLAVLILYIIFVTSSN